MEVRLLQARHGSATPSGARIGERDSNSSPKLGLKEFDVAYEFTMMASARCGTFSICR